LGQKRDNHSWPLIIRFAHYLDKINVMKVRQDLGNKDIYVSKDLTKTQRSKLLNLYERGQRGYYKGLRLTIVPEEGATARTLKTT
jgi:hypothetical protein